MPRERFNSATNQAEHKERTADLVVSGFESLVKELEQGVSEKFLEYLTFCTKFHHYSPYNQMLIWLQNPNASQVAGFQKWKQLGYSVRKGEKGIAILAPLLVSKEKAQDSESESQTKSLLGFKVVYVFDAKQLTEGKPLPSLIENLPDDSESLFNIVRLTMEVSGIQVELRRLGPSIHGISEGGKVVVSEEWGSQNQINILLHEWAHEIVHRTWISDKERRQLSKAVRECQAEAVAYVVSNYLGLSNPSSRDYLHLYGVDAQLLVDNLDIVQRASHYMIDSIEKQLGKDSDLDIEFSIVIE